MTANYYFYDCLSPLKSILEREIGLTSSDFGLYVSLYAFPNTFLLTAVFGGIILDRMGIRRAGLLFCLLMASGAIVSVYGISDYFRHGGVGYGLFSSFWPRYSPELKALFLGRFLFGLGGDTSIVAISKILVKWFRGRDLALAFALNIGLARLGSAAVFNVSPMIARTNAGWTGAVFFAGALLIIALVLFFVYMAFDFRFDAECREQEVDSCGEDFRIEDMTGLLRIPSFIYISALCMTFYSAVLPFQSYCPDFFLNKYHLSLEASGFIASLLSWGTILFTPVFGWIVDRWGKSASLMYLGSLLLLIAYLGFTFTKVTPYVPTFLLGVAFSLVPAALWPAVSKIVEDRKIGTAYGIMFTLQNLGLWLTPLLLGIILEKSNAGLSPELVRSGQAVYDYTLTILSLLLIGLLGFLFSWLLKREDRRTAYGLDLPMKQEPA